MLSYKQMNKLDKYTDGLDMEQFKRIDEISHYNHNYYVGLDNDLLFSDSDDDNTSEWWVISGTNKLLQHLYVVKRW